MNGLVKECFGDLISWFEAFDTATLRGGDQEVGYSYFTRTLGNGEEECELILNLRDDFGESTLRLLSHLPVYGGGLTSFVEWTKSPVLEDEVVANFVGLPNNKLIPLTNLWLHNNVDDLWKLISPVC